MTEYRNAAGRRRKGGKAKPLDCFSIDTRGGPSAALKALSGALMGCLVVLVP